MFSDMCVYIQSKEDVIEIIQEGIDAIVNSNAHMLTTVDAREIQCAFDDMAEWYMEGEEHE